MQGFSALILNNFHFFLFSFFGNITGWGLCNFSVRKILPKIHLLRDTIWCRTLKFGECQDSVFNTKVQIKYSCGKKKKKLKTNDLFQNIH